ncbi:hypothetical protein ABEF92_002739 [Exophiala dermatitidis]|uniref:Thioesterase domain-containing protein n=1 Tax=Exophiala dermatitidis (strain ATCC 34100 / CBS 525.76 / NIH/UT8656) TaxID=858893 RepID=H6C8Z9_EXODN|nr:uncharacterized protein HMPREF1120_08531 [Exophiala dermatitidis NIH/UT8656]EHY60576.1 hypothetical protein HMPREF1120_08531 [Exophiala dermatitidis NIH/UT8656]
MSPSPSLPNIPQSAQEEVSVFSSIPWCQRILSDPEWRVEQCTSRVLKPQTREDALLSQSLKSNDTIKGWVSLYKRPQNTTANSTNTNPTTTTPPNLTTEVLTLLSLQPGLNGYPGVCHGGIVATILDEVMSILVTRCRTSQGVRGDNVTADLHLTYVKPVPTPAVVLCRAKINDIKGRKYFVDGQIVDGESGTVLAKADALFITVQKEKL